MTLEVCDLTVSVKTKKLIKGISFDIQQEETLAIIGQSGSGKSLTALSLMGLLDKNLFEISGNIFLNGKDIEQLVEKQRKRQLIGTMAMIYQNPFNALMPVETIENQALRMFRVQKKLPNLKKMSELLEYTGLVPDRVLKKFPHELSGGELQRVMIAMNIATDPQLIICDEPTTALDHKTADQIISLLKKIKKELKFSILFISHDLTVVEQIADRILIVKEGQIVEEGKTHDIFQKPQNEYTKELIEVARLIP